METLKNDTLTEQELTIANADSTMFNCGVTYVNNLRMYFGYHSAIPNCKSIDYIDINRFMIWFEKEYENKIIKQHYRHDYDSEKKELETIDHFYFLEQGIMINVERSNIYILYPSGQETSINLLFDQCKKFNKFQKKTTDISLIFAHNGSLKTTEVFIKKPKIDFNVHYNEGFSSIHKTIVAQLNKKDTNGLYLFHGHPGTGKSTYIKFLIHQLKKKVIFISPKMAGELDNLNMTSFLLENRNSVLVIEDAEELITSREEVRNSNLSMLLNLTDGLLGESLGIQIIATFNTDVKNIDKALLRKGRLSTIYEFKPLTLEKTNILLTKLGHDITVTTEWALADIFNFKTNNNYEPKLKKAVGFGN